MADITVDVWLYGALTKYGGDAAQPGHANPQVTLPEGSTVRDLLARLEIPAEERGITFINGNLSAMPGLQPDLVAAPFRIFCHSAYPRVRHSIRSSETVSKVSRMSPSAAACQFRRMIRY